MTAARGLPDLLRGRKSSVRRGLVGPAQLRVLLCVLARPGRATTVRTVARRLGTRVYDVWLKLRLLRRLGLVTWDAKSSGTLRATCRLELF